MKKSVFCLLMALIMVLTNSISVFAKEGKSEVKEVPQNNYIFIVVNDELVEFPDALPEVRDDVTYVPVRFYAGALDCDVFWDGETKEVTISKSGQEDKFVILKTKENKLINSEGEEFELPIFSKEGRVMTPYRLIGEFFGYEVSYIKEGPIARIKDKNATITEEDIYKHLVDKIEAFKKEQAKLAEEKAKALEAEKKALEKEKAKKEKEKTPKKVIYLTFDDGPNSYTPAILDLLKKYDMKATFFMLSGNMKNNSKVVKRMADEGHGLGLHGVTHDQKKVYANNNSVVNEMNTANNTLKSIVGYKTKLVRVPYGSKPLLTKAQYNNLVNAGYKMWDWNIDSGDSKKSYVDPQKLIKDTTNYIASKKSGTVVVLFHDKKCTLEALEGILKWMQENNYTSESLTNEMKPLNWCTK